LLAQIGVPALQNQFEQAQFVFFAQSRHTTSILQPQLSVDNCANSLKWNPGEGG